jgi:hypothetical protein
VRSALLATTRNLPDIRPHSPRIGSCCIGK